MAASSADEQGPVTPVQYEEANSFAAVATAVLSRARSKRRECLRKSSDSVRLEEQREGDILPEAVQEKLRAAAKLARSRAWTRRRQKSTLNETCTSVISGEVADVDESHGIHTREEMNAAACNNQQETNVVSITIHNTDPPKAKVLLNKMVVRVSFLNEQSSALLKKSSHGRAVVSFYETHHPAVDYILPVLTGPAQHVSDRRGHLIPSWEECLIFNDQPSLLFHGPNTLILFELLLMTTIPSSSDLPWTCLAWGFLRPSVAVKKKGMVREGGVNGSCRIQLYRPPNLWKRRDKAPQAAELLNCVSPRPYSTSLHVSLGTVDPSELPQHALTRSLLPTLPEESQTRLEDLMQPFSASRPYLDSADSDQPTQTWSRLPGQPCSLPYQLREKLFTGSGGCVAVCFSPSGRLLAVACHHLNTFIIRLYTVPSFSEVRTWTVGKEIVYELCWASNDEWIAATCGSGLCHLWRVNDPIVSEVLLSHPAYVYCAVFVVDKIVTGAFDGSLRCWSNHKLQQVLSVHKTRVNTLSYDAQAGRVYSGDSSGAIGVWSMDCAVDSDGECAKLQYLKLYKHCEFQNHSIQRLILHPTQRKLLVHSLHNPLMMIDLRVWAVTQQYHTTDHTTSRPVGVAITPCGGIVMAGSSTLPLLYAWECVTGELLKSVKVPGLQGVPLTVSYHPYDHFTAVSSWSPQQHVVIMEGTT